ncbi:16S rRNA (adenine(1518)-N(6)/adenine(1519)-N(6))-dimethyltransferase RsmA [Sandaracinus amylolyticus]|uniref:16S rRNA (adenine(1518)-N(6)/adenine(1519)-N(6))- dimethyltransferase RsmA n=1 Tax=Sandaracinus amylolyticus TaxID=927083 RepID=UPI001F01A4A6|nr:16S rRNA (adenine(1518)-N(6)/adenine(1519)-N(6))-dimethyltransferase RsmA [Sandaracinus amylolyticus]UJR79030.1 Ribosomal RNA small subunit methyltransferase A [Sandaracinus amylolyticus]
MSSAPQWEDPRKVLARHGLAPKKAFSQNFLVSRHVVDGIVRAIAPRDGERVIELGPGLGTLTGALLGAGARVVAVEKDREMIAVLRAELGSNERFEVIEGDAAAVDLAALAGGERIALAGNLPYAITGGIVRNLCEHAASLSRAVIMVQKEVRDRLIAKPDTNDYGALTVFVQARFDVKPVLKVPAGSFHPPPKVESAVVMLVPREVPRAEETESFRTVVRAAFQARRKTLRNALGQAVGVERAEQALAAAGIDPKRRGETLSIEELAKVGEAIGAP